MPFVKNWSKVVKKMIHSFWSEWPRNLEFHMFVSFMSHNQININCQKCIVVILISSQQTCCLLTTQPGEAMKNGENFHSAIYLKKKFSRSLIFSDGFLADFTRICSYELSFLWILSQGINFANSGQIKKIHGQISIFS